MTQKLSLQDQAVINLCGWISCQWTDAVPDFAATLDLVLHQLRRALPGMTRDNGMIDQLHRAAIAILASAHDRRGLDWLKARSDLQNALAQVFFHRAAQACDALWPQPETPQQPEPAHAAD